MGVDSQFRLPNHRVQTEVFLSFWLLDLPFKQAVLSELVIRKSHDGHSECQ